MFKKITYLLFITLLVLSLSACQENEEKTKDNKDKSVTVVKQSNESKEKKEEDKSDILSEFPELKSAPEVPTTLEELAAYPAGPFASLSFEEEKEPFIKELNKLPKLGDGASEEVLDAYWRRLIQLFAADYKDPKFAFEAMKVNSFGSPEIKDPRYQFKDNLNVEIILDASGSMAGRINGQSKMELAKAAIKEFTGSLPENANIALRVYGHKGSNSDADKKLSCNSNELIYSFSPYNKENLSQKLNSIKPTGWTPVAASLLKAKEDLGAYPIDSNTNIVYLVSDGIETCDGDPVQAAKELKDSDVSPIVNIIGFDVDAEGQKQLQAAADAAGGIYANVYNREGLDQEFNRAKEIAEKWERWKIKAESDATSTKLERAYLINDVTNDWSSKNFNENLNLLGAILYLRDESKTLNGEAYKYISKKVKERSASIVELNKNLEQELRKLNEMTYEEMQKQIDEKFKANSGT